MWLTGFDVECLSSLYIENPMKAHSLMQAIACANRVHPVELDAGNTKARQVLKKLQGEKP